MKISVVTVTLNRAKDLCQTLQSVLGQTYDDWEYIVVDGGSSDNTVAELRKAECLFGDRLRWISEPDNGIYDAMNKGVALAQGDVVGFLGSGDVFFDEFSLQSLADSFRRYDVKAVFADLILVDPENTDRVTRYWHGSPYSPGIFNKGWQPAHPTFYVRRECFSLYGGFDTDLHISSDFDLMFRFLERERISSRYIPRKLVRMLDGGESNASLRNIMIAHRNIYRAFRKYGYKVPSLYSFRRLLPKIVNMIEARLLS